jgi:hypothetical protein
MKPKFLIIISLLLCFYGQGQNFNVIKNGNRTSYAQGIAAPSTLVDGDSIIYSATRTNRSLVNLCLRKFDRTGATIDSAFFDFSYLSGFIHLRQNALKQADKKKFLLVDFIDSSHAYTNLIAFNYGLDTSLHVTLEDSTWDVFGYDFLVEDSTLTVVSQLNRHLYNDQQLLISQYDTALNLLWQSTIPDWRGQQGGYFPARIMRLHDAYYISGRCVYPNWVESFLVKTDLQGQKIWDERYRIPNESSATFTLDEFNDTIVLVHGISTIGIEKKIWITQLDTAGVLLRDTIYPIEEGLLIPNDMVQTNTGEFVTVGYYKTDATGLFNGFMIKFDRDFNILWHRSYYHQSSFDENQLWRIHQWPDGNLLATGSLEWWDNRPPNVPHDHVWLLSLDSNGCLAPNNCGVLSLTEEPWPEKEEAFLVYTNPASDYVEIRWDWFEMALDNLFTVELITTNGQVLVHKEVTNWQNNVLLLDVSNLPAGIYVVQFKKADGNLLDNQKLTIMNK